MAMPTAAMVVLPKRLQTGAKIATEYLPSGQELIDRAVDRSARYGKDAAPRSEHRHTDDASMHIDHGSSFGQWAQLEIETHEAVDRSAATAVPNPIRIGNGSKMSERSAFVVPDGEDKMTGVRYRID